MISLLGYSIRKGPLFSCERREGESHNYLYLLYDCFFNVGKGFLLSLQGDLIYVEIFIFIYVEWDDK